LCLPALNHHETYSIEKDRLPEMKMYHEHTVHTSQQEQQTDKEVDERVQAMREAQHDDVEPDEEIAFEG